MYGLVVTALVLMHSHVVDLDLPTGTCTSSDVHVTSDGILC